LTVVETVSGIGGLLDGDWTNPSSIYVSNPDSFPSGDGVDETGDHFIFNFTLLRADWNLDNIVDAADWIVWKKFKGTGGGTAPFTWGDANGDGVVNTADERIWEMLFGTDFTQW
jgi:hypothetical protein